MMYDATLHVTGMFVFAPSICRTEFLTWDRGCSYRQLHLWVHSNSC